MAPIIGILIGAGKLYAIIRVNVYKGSYIAAAERSGARAAYRNMGASPIALRSPLTPACGFRFYRP